MSAFDEIASRGGRFGLMTLTFSQRDGKFQATYRGLGATSYSVELDENPEKAVLAALGSPRQFAEVERVPAPKPRPAADAKPAPALSLFD